MVEKDILLHQVLTDLSNDKFFAKNMLFKGGTCLIKHYLGYFRFSEDMDFTWKDQSRFEGKTAGKIRSDLSSIIDGVGRTFEGIASKRGLDFRCAKGNKNYVELGGSNKTCTFKVWYYSEVLRKKTFFKVQINFVEEICTRPKKGELKSIFTGNQEELAAVFPEEYREYSNAIPFAMYDVGEILSEKVRALLTREGVKARDFLDIFFISKKIGIRPEGVEECITKKVNHALRLYAKYRANLNAKIKLLEQGNIFEWGTEKDLLVDELDESEFYRFVGEFTGYLKTLVSKFKK
ncbi:MAG TPA: nucleotidyl transferase AbiEii/AbiGii toxin family protein [Nitrososphaera sp.]|nr:nucleotidyl transferase AbiEii/AbiGii toxin family protein [Nitrososphaera sp.]